MAAELAGAQRRPDGVAVDPTSSPPAAKHRANSDEDLVTLQTPLGVDVALDTARQFFDAIVREDITAMAMLADHAAIAQDIQDHGELRVHNLIALWRERFRKRQHQELAARSLFRESDVRVYRGASLQTLPLAIRYLASGNTSELWSKLGDDDMVLHVPIAAHTMRSERLLGDEMYLWLRRDSDRFVIYRVAEAIP